MTYSFPKIELAIFSTKISSKSTRYRIDRNQCDGKFLLNFKTGKWTSKKNPRPLKKISPSDEKEFEPFKFYAPVNVPARKSRIFCFRGVFTIREGMKEGWIEPLPPELTSRYRSLASYYPPAHLRCARARARTDHCKRRYRMNGIAIPFAETNLSTNLIVGRITDQCRYLW